VKRVIAKFILLDSRILFWERTPLRIVFTDLGLRSKYQTWFRKKCRLLPDKDCFHFVYAKYDSGYLSEVCHFVPQEVTTAKSVKHPPFLKNHKTCADLGRATWKNSTKISYWGNGFIKSFLSHLKTWLKFYTVWFASDCLSRITRSAFLLNSESEETERCWNRNIFVWSYKVIYLFGNIMLYNTVCIESCL